MSLSAARLPIGARFLRVSLALGSRRRDGGESDPRPPRLALRFAIYTAVGLSLAAAVILLFVRHHVIAQAERSVTSQARFVATSILAERLKPADFERPVTPPRRAALDRLFGDEVRVGGTVGVKLYGADGRVTYSNDHSLIGTLAGDLRAVDAAASGAIASDVGLLGESGSGENLKVLKAYAPVRLVDDAVAGVLELDHDYTPVARAARKAFLPVAGVLQLVLTALYLSLFPILRRVTRQLREQMQAIQHQALHDDLTGLPNRALFHDRVDQALLALKREAGGGAVMLVDLDRFKEINDTLGHQSGDLLLQELAVRLRRMLRDTDTIARLGGDEFAVVAPGAGDAESVLFLAERIRQEVGKPFLLSGVRLEVETSAGIALFPEHGEDVETLMRHADVALYESKETHRPQLYASEADYHSPARLGVVGELRRAIERRELVVYYQPRVEFDTGRAQSVEALVRWQHPDRGLLAPSEFVPVAEQTGLIRPLTRYVLDAALGQVRAWRDEGIEVGVAVNLSARDILDLGFPDEAEELLAKWDADAAWLELEISENTILKDAASIRAVLSRLRERGIALAIDDFGRGYSSLSHLKRLPVDVLKIDRSFVANMASDEDDAVIVRSTIDLAHNLGLQVVAEGVEDEHTCDHLAALGCDTAQGFYLSRPASAGATTRWLREVAGEDGRGVASSRIANAHVTSLPAKKKDRAEGRLGAAAS